MSTPAPQTGRGSRPGRGRLVAALPPLILLLEVIVFILVFRAIGWWAVVAVLAISLVGVLVIARSSSRAWRDIRQMRATGSAPSRTASDAAITLAGGFMIALPGFVTAVLGLVLLLPFTRTATRRLVGYLLTRRVGRALGVTVHYGAGRRFDGPVVPGDRADQANPAPTAPGSGEHGGAAAPGSPRVIEGRIVSGNDEPPR